MNVSKEIQLLCNVLNLTETELGSELGVSYETVNNWKHNRKNIDDSNLEKLYCYAYNKDIKINNIYEQLLKENNVDDDNIVLFHGAKKDFSMPIDIDHNSKLNNDFGKGFYLGENYEQAANYISTINKNKVYAFKMNTKNLKIYKYNVDNDWMISIAYFRGWLKEYENTIVIQKILQKIQQADVIIAPIADNRMFDIINEFVENEITDEQCRHALAATNLGYQYVLKTKKAIDSISYLQELYVCNKEKEKCIEGRVSLTNNGLQKVKMARIEYKNQGRYIGEILK